MVLAVPTSTALRIRERWGERLRVARVVARETQAEAGESVDIAGPTVAKAEAGWGSVETYDRLARHYGLTLTLGATPTCEAEAS